MATSRLRLALSWRNWEGATFRVIIELLFLVDIGLMAEIHMSLGLLTRF